MIYSFLMFSNFFESFKSKSTQKLRSQIGNSGVSFNDTLKFRALAASRVSGGTRVLPLYCTVPCGVLGGGI